MNIWISALIPMKGADIYEGVRLQASLSETDVYQDLADWLEIEYEGVDETIEALNNAVENSVVLMYKVEKQEFLP